MIFISYSQKDKKVVEKFVTKLSKANIKVWVDYQSLNLKKDIKPQLTNAIKSATKFVLFDTVNSRESIWVKFELNLAYENLNKDNILHTPPYSLEEICTLLIKENAT